MLTSTLYHLLSVTCLGLYAVQLCCAINIHHEKAVQTMTHCLRNCSHLSKDLIETQLNAKVLQLSSRQSCYKECLQKIGKHDIQQTKPLFKRIKRDASSPQANSKQSNESNDLCHNYTYDINIRGLNAKKYIKVSFYNNTGRIYANISWNPPPETANWTGYMVFYANSDWQIKCTDVKKNVTSIFVFHDWKRLARLQILSLPPVKVVEGEGYRPYHVRIKTVTTGQPSTTTSPYPNQTSATTSPYPLYSTKITNKTDNPTTFSPAVYSTKITNKTDNPTTFSPAVSITLPVTTTAIVAILIAVAVVVYWYFGCSCGKTTIVNEVLMKVKWQFDAFIIYSSEDEKWVHNTLLSTLEEKHGFKCCIHYRDFLAGKPFRQNMVDSVYNSRKTVAVVSRSFLKSTYCKNEMDMALGRLLERRDDSVVVIKLDDVDRKKLPKALKQRSYIDYPKSTEKETWEKQLVNCLKTPIKHASGDNFV